MISLYPTIRTDLPYSLPFASSRSTSGAGSRPPPSTPLLEREVRVLTGPSDELGIESDRPVIIIPFKLFDAIINKITPFFPVEDCGRNADEGQCCRLMTSREVLSKSFFSKILECCRSVPSAKKRTEIFTEHAAQSREFAKIPAPEFVPIPSSLLESILGDRFLYCISRDPRETISTVFATPDACLERERTILAESLKAYPGICVGELHSDFSPKFFLIQHMTHLRELGVKVLYTEFHLYDIHQELLDVYNRLPKDAPIPALVEESLRDYGSKLIRGAGFIDVYRAAHEAGIEIVAIDTERSYTSSNELVSLYRYRIGTETDRKRYKSLRHDRVVEMNKDALAIITKRNKTLKSSDKYIVYCGHGHSVPHDYDEPGLAQYLKIPAIFVEDCEKMEARHSNATILYNSKLQNKLLLTPHYYTHFHLIRPQFFGYPLMGDLEISTWDDCVIYSQMYDTNKPAIEAMLKNKVPVHRLRSKEAELNAIIKDIRSRLLLLYKHSENLLLIDSTKDLLLCFEGLKNSIEKVSKGTHSELAKSGVKSWISYQHDHQGCYDIDKATEVCDVLQALAPSGITFDRRHLSGFIEGGVCSAMSLKFLLELSLIRKINGFCSFPSLISYIFYYNNYKDVISLRPIQAAMNTIVKTTNDAPGSSEQNIKALFKIAGFDVLRSSEIFDIDTEVPNPSVIDAIKTLPDGTYVFRTVLPKMVHSGPGSVDSGEVHGHTTLVLRQGSSIAIYDPNSGVHLFDMEKEEMGIEKASLEIYNIIFKTHVSFNTPKLQIHYLSEPSIDEISTHLRTLFETPYADPSTLVECSENVLSLMQALPESIAALRDMGWSFADTTKLIDECPRLFEIFASTLNDRKLLSVIKAGNIRYFLKISETVIRRSLELKNPVDIVDIIKVLNLIPVEKLNDLSLAQVERIVEYSCSLRRISPFNDLTPVSSLSDEDLKKLLLDLGLENIDFIITLKQYDLLLPKINEVKTLLSNGESLLSYYQGLSKDRFIYSKLKDYLLFLKANPDYDFDKALTGLEELKEKISLGQISKEDVERFPPAFYLRVLLDLSLLQPLNKVSKSIFFQAIPINFLSEWSIEKIDQAASNCRFLEALYRLDPNMVYYFLFSANTEITGELYPAGFIEVSALKARIRADMPKPFIIALAEANSENVNPKFDDDYKAIAHPLNEDQQSVIVLFDELATRGFHPNYFEDFDPADILLMSKNQEMLFELIEYNKAGPTGIRMDIFFTSLKTKVED